MMCKKCVYGWIGHTNISISDQQQSGTRNELGDNRSRRPELFRKIKFRLIGMPIGENLLIAEWEDLIKNFFDPFLVKMDHQD